MKLGSIGILQKVARSPFPLLPRALNHAALFSFEIQEQDAPKIENAMIQAGQSEK